MVTVGVVVGVDVGVPVETGGFMDGVVVVVVVPPPQADKRSIATRRNARGMNAFFISAPFKIL